MQELLIILRNCCVHEPWVGRRSLRAGAIYNADDATARRLLDGGYARRAVQPAPLFVDATTPPVKPKKKGKEPRTDGRSSDSTHDAS